MRKGKTKPSTLPTVSRDGLGNPVAAGVAATAVSQIPWGWLFRTGVIVGLVAYGINSFKKRFTRLNEVSGYNDANISYAQANMKADIIHKAMLGFGNGFKTVRENIAGLNYNGWVRLYNAFGNRADSIPGNDDMNLIEWFQDQFSNNELNELRVLVPNVF